MNRWRPLLWFVCTALAWDTVLSVLSYRLYYLPSLLFRTTDTPRLGYTAVATTAWLMCVVFASLLTAAIVWALRRFAHAPWTILLGFLLGAITARGGFGWGGLETLKWYCWTLADGHFELLRHNPAVPAAILGGPIGWLASPLLPPRLAPPAEQADQADGVKVIG